MNDFFAMGFCKAAEEHGVDPVQLAKYAATNNVSAVSGPKYKTDGWAPSIIPANGVPFGRPFDFLHDLKGVRLNSVRDLSALQPGTGDMDTNPYFESMKSLNPRLNAWWNAHTNTLKSIGDIVLPHYSEDAQNRHWLYRGGDHIKWLTDNKYYDKDNELVKLIEDAYAKGMMARTNDQQKAVSPALKK